MTNFCKVFISLLLCGFGVAESQAGEATRDSRADLIKIATRYVDSYSKLQHKAGDADGIFIEEVVIPSVVSVVDDYSGKIPSFVRREVYQFLIAGKSMASEELATLAAALYQASPKQFCSDMSKQRRLDRRFLVQQASDGLTLSGANLSKVSCH